MRSNIERKKIALNVRRDGPQSSIFGRTLSAITNEVARTLRGNKVSLEYIRLKAFEQTLSNLGHNDPELASHLTTFYLEHRFPRDAQRAKESRKDGLSCSLRRLRLVEQK